MRLRILKGPLSGQTVEAKEAGVLLGRAPDCDVVLGGDDQVSREHAKVFKDGNDYYVKDLNSTNGVRVNGARIDGKQKILPGDQVSVGGTTFVLVDDAAALASEVTVSATRDEVLKEGTKPTGGEPAAAKEAAKPAGEPAAGKAAGPEVPPPPRRRTNPLAWVALLLVVALVAWVVYNKPKPGAPVPPVQVLGSGSDSGAPAPTPDGTAASPPEAGTAATPATPGGTPPGAGTPGTPPKAKPPTGASPGEMMTPEMEPGAGSIKVLEGGLPGEDLKPPPPAAEAKARYVWVDTVPTGVAVMLGNKACGQTPVVLEDLPDGRHTLKFSQKGYEDLFRDVDVPNAGTLQKFSLKQSPGSTIVASEPPGAAVLHGKRYLGQTPLLLQNMEQGEYPLTILLARHEEFRVTVPVDPVRPVSVMAKLVPMGGGFAVSTLPPGAKVMVNDQLKGTTQPTRAGCALSAPLELHGFKPGSYRISAEFEGEKSAVQTIELKQGAVPKVKVGIWLPDLQVMTKKGDTINGMVLDKTAGGDLVLVGPDLAEIRLTAAEVEQSTAIPLNLAKDLRKQQVKPEK